MKCYNLFKLQNYLKCSECGANAFKDNQQELIGFMMSKFMNPIKFKDEFLIDVRKFTSYKEPSKKVNRISNGFKKRSGY